MDCYKVVHNAHTKITKEELIDALKVEVWLHYHKSIPSNHRVEFKNSIQQASNHFDFNPQNLCLVEIETT